MSRTRAKNTLNMHKLCINIFYYKILEMSGRLFSRTPWRVYNHVLLAARDEMANKEVVCIARGKNTSKQHQHQTL